MTIREGIHGVESIQFRLFRPLDRLDANLAAFTKACVYDGRSAEPVAEGRLADPGRSGQSDGQVWEINVDGPVVHASDITAPYVVIDRTVSDGLELVDVVHPDASIGATTKPGDSSASPTQGLLAQFGDGIAVNTNSRVVIRYSRIWQAGQKLGGYAFNWDSGLTATDWRIQGVTRTDGGTGEVSGDVAFNVAGGNVAKVVDPAAGSTDFPNGRNTLELRILWQGGAAATTGDTAWGWFEGVMVRALLLTKAGAEITSGYLATYVLAHNVIEDLLGRFLTQYDGASASIAATGTQQIQQLAYPDGITPAEVLDDLMKREPGYYWTTGPSTSSGKPSFTWATWPSTVRYEATMADGGEFPLSTRDLYNKVWVRWVDSAGVTRWTPRTLACALLDDEGITRAARIDLDLESGTLAAAQAVGDAFLADHNVPKCKGTLTIAREIRDLWTGAKVQPWQIKPAHLIRVRGVEAYPDALNASSNDGQTVFRIWTRTYTSETNSAVLELDDYAVTESNVLAGLVSTNGSAR